MKKLILLFIAIGIMWSCSKENEVVSNCDFKVLSDRNEYVRASNDSLKIERVEIMGDCLNIAFNSSGCDGESWAFKLIHFDAEDVNFPNSELVRLSLNNEEDCAQLIRKEVSYDLKSLQKPSINQLDIRFENTGDVLVYTY